MKHYLCEKFEQTILPTLQQHKNIGFFISGGWDSALLLYICCKIKQKYKLNFNIKIYTVPKFDNSFYHSQQVLSYINSIFDINLIPTSVGDPTLHHSEQLKSGVVEVWNDECDIFIIGHTTTPQHLPNGPDRVKNIWPRLVMPFENSTKDYTVALGIELGEDHLMTITHTCTESQNIRCKKCWQCRERQWAFQCNDYIDPGNL